MPDILVVFIHSQNKRNEQIDMDSKSEKATVKLAFFTFRGGIGDRMQLIYYVLRRDWETKAVIFIRLRTRSGLNRLKWGSYLRLK